ncbi:MAG TPA: DUF92 domain-containing protein, partial [Candidatus Hodarchaeales archaeon]|nr:DUF92 domain-containing protein [Candidatus Hodarchaeales archaeon]
SMVFIAAMGASLADTMGTEIGVLSKEVPRSVLRPWKKAAKGESGAISIVGSLASMVTALLFSLLMVVSILIDPSIDVKLPPNAIIIAAGAAFLGMFFDSALGSTLQEQRICEECEKKVESRIHHDKPTVYFSGLRNLNNETINFVSTTTTGIISGLLFLLF